MGAAFWAVWEKPAKTFARRNKVCNQVKRFLIIEMSFNGLTVDGEIYTFFPCSCIYIQVAMLIGKGCIWVVRFIRVRYTSQFFPSWLKIHRPSKLLIITGSDVACMLAAFKWFITNSDMDKRDSRRISADGGSETRSLTTAIGAARLIDRISIIFTPVDSRRRQFF